MTAALPTLMSCAFGVLVAAAALADPLLLTAAVALCILTMAMGWGELLGLPDPAGSGATVLAAGWIALLLAYLRSAQDSPLGALAGLMALCVLAAFGHELLRKDGRKNLVGSVTGTLSGEAIAVFGAGWVLLSDLPVGSDVVACTAAAAVGALAVCSTPLPSPALEGAAVLTGTVLCVLVSLFLLPGATASLALCGAGVAAAATGVDRLLRPAVRSSATQLSMAAAPVILAGTAGYVAFRVLVA
ncbi:MAG: hypothetical protein QG608_57 [Actinomycetota bacterium]|nr:hypothetical protein [Actinomycetota bacterium]